MYLWTAIAALPDAVSRAALSTRVRNRRSSDMTGAAMKILVIEDDAETASFLANGLQENGHAVDLAVNGRDGLFLSTSGQYDVAVVDRMLPQLDGLSLVRAMRSAG